jgi:hypothetical protein
LSSARIASWISPLLTKRFDKESANFTPRCKFFITANPLMKLIPLNVDKKQRAPALAFSRQALDPVHNLANPPGGNNLADNSAPLHLDLKSQPRFHWQLPR